jgi:hypothetical protein
MGKRHNAKGRSKPRWYQQFMDGHIQVPNAVMASEAITTARPSSVMVLLMMTMQLGKIGTSHNGKLAFPDRAGIPWWDSKDKRWISLPVLHLSRSTIGAAIRDLEQRSLIACTRHFTFDQKRKAKEYRLTWLKTDDGPATHDYLNYRHQAEDGEAVLRSERRPIHRPVGKPIGRPVGTSDPMPGRNGRIQADASAYADNHRPTGRHHYYQLIGLSDLVPACGPADRPYPCPLMRAPHMTMVGP